MTVDKNLILWFDDLNLSDVPRVGGKNASLGELHRSLTSAGVKVPNGFAITADAYRLMLEQEGTAERIAQELSGLDKSKIVELQRSARKIRSWITHLPFPPALRKEILEAYRRLCQQYGPNTDVAVRSSATAEDLPDASFAGQQDSYLNICGEEELLHACRRCFASLFTERAISYRQDQGFDHLSVALSVGVQKMVRSDLASAGVIFTIDTESGFRDVVLITGAYGLGENVVQGKVNPDEFCVFKPTLSANYRPIISHTLGSKKTKLVYDPDGKTPTKEVRVPKLDRERFVLEEEEVLTLARWAIAIEDHYSSSYGKSTPMDLEWAKDGESGELFIVQARPETVVSQSDLNKLEQFQLLERGSVLSVGRAVGQRIGVGSSHVIQHVKDIEQFSPGEVLVTSSTDPDWEPVMKTAAAIVTDKGGRTSHAAIVSRELGIPCVVGCGNATATIPEGVPVTVSCAEGDAGKIYPGELKFEKKEVILDQLPETKTKIALNVGNPDTAFSYSSLPNDGVGLARLEFIVSSYIGIHPRALAEFDSIKDKEIYREIARQTHGYSDKSEYFVERLAEGVGRIAAAFYPKPVIVRMSDFKSNEYANLIGGTLYEPQEENPMIGWRGASRYYSEGYRSGFALECRAFLKVREIFGLTNVIPMIPFCRTPEEGKLVLAEMAKNGLKQGENGLAVYCMCEIPSNVLLAEAFLDVFDGFSIGTNDLTQLTLGLDRDSELVSHIFDERNEAIRILVRQVIDVAREKGKYIGICGDAPSTFPEFAAFLVEAGIEAVSLTPDAALAARLRIAEQEKSLGK